MIFDADPGDAVTATDATVDAPIEDAADAPSGFDANDASDGRLVDGGGSGDAGSD
jgi:hypothetical protein